MWSKETLEELSKYIFVLGSSSPRRREILSSNVGVKQFTIVTSSFEENLSKENMSDVEYVTRTAEHKISSILSQLEKEKDYVLLVADTIVSCGGKVFEKPSSPEEQLAMLNHYRHHFNGIRVITAIHACQISGQKVINHEIEHEITLLNFDSQLSDSQLQYYIDTKEGLGVAGGFKYQGEGSMLFNGIQGDYFNVVGLPVKKTHVLLERILRAH